MLCQPRGVVITVRMRSTISPGQLPTKDRCFGLVRLHQREIADTCRGRVFAKAFTTFQMW